MGLMLIALVLSIIIKLKFQKMNSEISAVPGDTLKENTQHETRDEEYETKSEEPQQFCSSDTALEVGSILQ